MSCTKYVSGFGIPFESCYFDLINIFKLKLNKKKISKKIKD